MVAAACTYHGRNFMSKKITVLAVEPEKAPYVKEIDPGLESLQQEVGGDIQAI